MAEKNSGIGTFLGGLLVGGLAGAVIALLNAPRPAQETRAQIRTKGIELKDTTEQKVEEFWTQGRAAVDESQKQWTKASEEIKQIASEAIAEIRRAAVQAAKESRDETQEAIEETKDAAMEAR